MKERSLSPALRRYGVPTGGPWHREAAAISNLLVGLPEGQSIFEVLEGQGEFEVVRDGCVAVLAWNGTATLDAEAVSTNGRFKATQGQRLHVRSGLAYIAANVGSKSSVRLADSPFVSLKDPLRFLPATDLGLVPTLAISPASSRAGVRLVGLAESAPASRLSEPACVGAIQRTPKGELILIGPDGPVIGGYPIVGYVIEADLDRISLLRPGAEVTLSAVTEAESAAIWEETVARRAKIRKSIGLATELQPDSL